MDVLGLVSSCWADAVSVRRPRRGAEEHLTAALDWLCRAQDTTADGGVSAWYSLVSGWGPSYIETTGYIIQTFLAAAEYFDDDDLADRALRMADFLVEMQHPNGGLRTHPPSVKPTSPPTVFNTGQDLIGLADAAEYLDRTSRTHRRPKRRHAAYRRVLAAAAAFVCKHQQADGSWVRYTFGTTSHTYHTRVALGLLRAWQVVGKQEFRRHAVKQLNWAVSHQRHNGWFDKAELPPPNPPVPYTHTIAYVIEGLLWSGLILEDDRLVDSAERAARPLRDYYLRHSFLPATFDKNWRSGDSYSCLTGNAQLAVVWWQLGATTSDKIYHQAAQRMTRDLQATQDLTTTNLNIWGAIKGSFPVYGDVLSNTGYCRLTYLNWATKFFADAVLFSQRVSMNQSLPLPGMIGSWRGTRR